VSAQSLNATLVRQYNAQSVTGRPIVVCVYSVYTSQGPREFERQMPVGSFCPPTVQVQ
jgi:hypothetical protein